MREVMMSEERIRSSDDDKMTEAEARELQRKKEIAIRVPVAWRPISNEAYGTREERQRGFDDV